MAKKKDNSTPRSRQHRARVRAEREQSERRIEQLERDLTRERARAMLAERELASVEARCWELQRDVDIAFNEKMERPAVSYFVRWHISLALLLTICTYHKCTYDDRRAVLRHLSNVETWVRKQIGLGPAHARGYPTASYIRSQGIVMSLLAPFFPVDGRVSYILLPRFQTESGGYKLDVPGCWRCVWLAVSEHFENLPTLLAARKRSPYGVDVPDIEDPRDDANEFVDDA